MKNEATTMVKDSKLHALPLGTSGSSARDHLDDFGAPIIADRLYSDDGPSGRDWQGREQYALGYFDQYPTSGSIEYKTPAGSSPEYGPAESGLSESQAQGRVNAIMADLVIRYKYSSIYLMVVTALAILSEVAF